MSYHRRMADDYSRMAAQSATQAFPPPPLPPFLPQQTQTTEQGRAGGEAFTSNRPPAMWSFMGSNFNGAEGGGRWVSESRTESWINGQRRSTHKRRDANVRSLLYT